MAKTETIANCMTMLSETYRQKLTRSTLEAYRIALEDIGDEDLLAACTEALKQCKFMPVPAELREFVHAAGDSPESRAVKAFAVVDRAVQRLGRGKTVQFDDPLINAAINLCGGWLRFCDATLENFNTWLRKEFCREYAGLVRRPPTAEMCRPSPGEYFRVNGYFHRHDRLRKVASGLPLGPVQQRLSDARERLLTDDRPADIPRLDLKRVEEQNDGA